ncbi:MAG: zinc-ribbon and DUF3426 domain-containing protein [Betaproteobacteria bacterium]
MSLAARCPQCHTVFRISGEQLSAAQGWVRCGGCGSVFDATTHLATPDGAALEVPTVHAPVAAPAPAPSPAPTPVPSATPPLQAMPDIDLELPDLGALPPAPPVPAPAPAPASTPEPRPTPGPAPSPTTVAPAAAAPGPSPLLVLALLLSLLALMAYAARGPIVQQWPQLRPWVVQGCASLGCQLPAERNLQALQLLGSSLSQDDSSGHHQLRLQWHNRGDAPVLIPSIDLSIVDAQGDVLARRTLEPSELQPVLHSLAPGAETAMTVVLDLRALAPEGIASFRVSTYYP